MPEEPTANQVENPHGTILRPARRRRRRKRSKEDFSMCLQLEATATKKLETQTKKKLTKFQEYYHDW